MSTLHNGRIYLSGGMQFSPNLGAGWREHISDRLTQLGFIPLNITELDVAYTNAHADCDRAWTDGESNIEMKKSIIRRHFVNADIELIRQHTDAVIVYYDESVRLGAGTISEVHDAYMAGIPVFLVNAYPSISDVPGWMQAETTKMFASFDEMFEYLQTLPPGILRQDVYGNRRSDSFYLCSLCGTVSEKSAMHFVSRVSPVYCKRCVEITKQVTEDLADRYQFFIDYLSNKHGIT